MFLIVLMFVLMRRFQVVLSVALVLVLDAHLRPVGFCTRVRPRALAESQSLVLLPALASVKVPECNPLCARARADATGQEQDGYTRRDELSFRMAKPQEALMAAE
jgi:hypothetical protein